VPTAFQGFKCVRGGLKQRESPVRARYQIRANAVLVVIIRSMRSRSGSAILHRRFKDHRNRIRGRVHGALCAIQHLGVVASQATPEGESA